jgi:membrane AbrB-like protein
MNELRFETLWKFPATLAIAVAGGAVFHLAGLPAAWLSGAMILVAAATLAGVPTVMPNKFRDGLFVLLGISMGAGVQPEVVERVSEWPLSMAMLLLVVVGVTIAGYCVLRYAAHWPKETAFFGAIPGTLAYVIALASERRADLPRIASTQSVRLFFLIALLPFAVVSTTDTDASVTVSRYTSDLWDYAIGVPLCILGSLLRRESAVSRWMDDRRFFHKCWSECVWCRSSCAAGKHRPYLYGRDGRVNWLPVQ